MATLKEVAYGYIYTGSEENITNSNHAYVLHDIHENKMTNSLIGDNYRD